MLAGSSETHFASVTETGTLCTGSYEDAAARSTLIVYLLIELSCAVTTTVMEFAPTVSAIELDELPLVTVVPLTVTVAVASATVGVIVIEVTLFATFIV